MTAPGGSPRLFPVDAGGPLGRFADRLVVVRIDDPDGVLGRCPDVMIDRADPARPSPPRSIPIDAAGRGRFLGWLPDDPLRLSFAPDPGGAAASGRPPRFRFAAVSRGVMVAMALCRPRALMRVLRLFVAGNRKGAAARFARLFDAIAAPSYAAWTAVRDAEDARDRPALPAEVERWPWRPSVAVRILGTDEAARAATRASLAARTRSAVDLIEEDVGDGAAGDLVLVVEAGTRLSPDAVVHLVRPFVFASDVVGAHADEDEIDGRGRRRSPVFHPAWSRAFAEAGGVAPAVAVMRADVAAIGGGEGPIAARLLAAADRGRIAHVPRVLAHRPAGGPRRAVAAVRIPRLAEGERPAVSVIVPSRDRAELLEACLGGLFERTAGVELDVVVIDNGSREAATARLYDRLAAEPRFRRIDRPGPFNFPDLIAAGLAVARHDLVLLLNNDVEPLEPDWLRAMVAELREPGIGAVGARLLFPDGSVQHGGVTLGAGGVARHTFPFFDPHGGEDRGWLARRRDVSAVTAACLLTRRTHWDSVGGMDAAGFAVAFNDVDFCLRLRASGLAVVWTPAATLIHRESVSRGTNDTPAKRARLAREEAAMAQRWGDVLRRDPFHHPSLSLVGEPFVLEARPRDRAARFPR